MVSFRSAGLLVPMIVACGRSRVDDLAGRRRPRPGSASNQEGSTSRSGKATYHGLADAHAYAPELNPGLPNRSDDGGETAATTPEGRGILNTERLCVPCSKATSSAVLR